jgi:hypothetical protein
MRFILPVLGSSGNHSEAAQSRRGGIEGLVAFAEADVDALIKPFRKRFAPNKIRRFV